MTFIKLSNGILLKEFFYYDLKSALIVPPIHNIRRDG